MVLRQHRYNNSFSEEKQCIINIDSFTKNDDCESPLRFIKIGIRSLTVLLGSLTMHKKIYILSNCTFSSNMISPVSTVLVTAAPVNHKRDGTDVLRSVLQ